MYRTKKEPLVSSAVPVTINAMTGEQRIVHFFCHDFAVNEERVFKDQEGCVSFVIHVCLDNGGEGENLEYTSAPGISPVLAVYKLETFMTYLAGPMFADSDINLYQARKAQLMVDQIDRYSNMYFGLTAAVLVANYQTPPGQALLAPPAE